MKTLKRNVIIIDPGEQLEIQCGDSRFEIRANPDLDHEPNAPEFEISIPPGNTMSGLTRSGWTSPTFCGDEGKYEELPGPAGFIIFSHL